MFNIIRQDLINGVDTNQIREDYIVGFEEALENSDDPFETQEIEESLAKLYLLYNSTDDMKANAATFKEIQARCVDNLIYDETRPTTIKKRFQSKGKTLLRVNELRQHSIDKNIIKKFDAYGLPITVGFKG